MSINNNDNEKSIAEVGFITDPDDVNQLPLVLTVQSTDKNPIIRIFEPGTAAYIGAVMIPKDCPKTIDDIIEFKNNKYKLSKYTKLMILQILNLQDTIGFYLYEVAQMLYEHYHS